MNNKTKNKVRVLYGWLILIVFVISLLIKPAHMLQAHHESSEGVCVNQHGMALTADHFEDCPICDFEFCTFIPQKQIGIPQVTLIVRNGQVPHTVACLANISTHLFQLRAPPAL